ncbi:DNA polymerase III subunit beta [Alloprevotella tannerae]|uniref:Beta sliding clamp n=1 Tax=Alloprevotella tannerae TaxID=76122 RepID=A0A929X012_9BACT|nr:DNA polymerase III subunit beta [Alloprevotella tannerae]MBF0970333.1 DNA polymerase III subunit beta [Alloprevotella tannerae]
MKFVISSSVLSARLQSIGRVIAAKTTMPILNCFVFDIKSKRLELTAADNEITLRTYIDLVENDADIRFAVNAKTIQDAIKEIPEQPLEIFVNESNMEITVEYQNGKYNFMAESADEYPIPPALNKETMHVNITSGHLLNAINRSLFAAANDPLRPMMNGIYFDLKTSGLTMVASDGQKMACNTLVDIKVEKPGSFILPQKPATLLKNILGKEEDTIEMAFDGRRAVFKGTNFEMNCRLTEGRFPNYAGVIPQDNPNIISVNREALIAALRRVLIFSNAVSSLVKLNIDNGKMRISSQDTDYSMSAEENLLCDYSGTPIKIGYRGPFLLELLNNLPGEEVVFKLGDASRAGLILPMEQEEGEDILMLLMPMMIID